MKKKLAIIIPVAIAICLAFVLIGAMGTGAWFTDQDKVPSILTAGKLDIDLRGNDSNGINILLGTTQDFKGGMEPYVWYGPYTIEIYNQGWGVSTIACKYAWTANFVSGNGNMFNKLNVKIRDGNVDWFTAGWYAGQGYIYNGPLSGVVNITPGIVIVPNITRGAEFYFQLDASADNSYQGVQTVFDLTLVATQVDNPGWSQ